MVGEDIGPKRGRFNVWRVSAWTLATSLWLLPLAAMQVTAEVNWTASDFTFAAVLIGGVGLTIELTVRSTRDIAYRAAIGLLLAAMFLLIWINAAVGIIGDEDNPLNLLYGGVLLVALAGTIGARFRAVGMARAMIASAIAVTLVGIVAVVLGGNEPPGAIGEVLLNGFFVLLFVGSAWLFRKVSVSHRPAGHRLGSIHHQDRPQR